ncbi:MAG: phenol hydroxylase subunit [Polyangiaceae bacterium]|nr:phenol hydroxylase subunit [Polyangiaceae bacterium]
MSAVPPAPEDRWDVQRRFIRIVKEHGSGMVEFEFAIGEPGLFVEMVMPRPQFLDFCAMQGVEPTHDRLPEQGQGNAENEWKWSLRDARERRFRHEF